LVFLLCEKNAQLRQPNAIQKSTPPPHQDIENGGSGGARTRDKSNASLAKTDSPSQIASQKSVATGQDLSQVVNAWSKLPESLKAAILAIVGSVTSSPEAER
jgi:hypothetical protein